MSATRARGLCLVAVAVVLGGVSGPAAIEPVRAAPAITAAPAFGAPSIMDLATDQAAMPATPGSLEPFGKTTPLNATRTISNPKLQREVFGFVDAGNLGNTSVGYPSWQMNLLSTVAFFDLQVNSGDGNLVTSGTGWSVYHSSTMSNFVNVAHANGVRVIVSINMHDFSTSPTSQMCTALISTNAQHTIDQAVQQMQIAGIDGINLNYEGTIATCANGLTNRTQLVSMVKNLRTAMGSAYLAIDTFSGAAEDNQEFFDITGLAPYVDSFFVMAYDMDEANYFEAPLNCSSYCFNPVSPLNTYRFNVTKSMAQYTALVPASKVILGQPYYGRRGCVPSLNGAHQVRIPGTNFAAPTYQFASTIRSSTGVSKFAAHRDPSDGVSEWDTWFDSDWNCNREQYFDDVYSLGAKYNVVIQDNLRGVGLFTLDYGGGAPELWSLLNTYFSCPVDVTLAASETTTEFTLGLSAGTCSVARFEVQQLDSTLGVGWFAVPSVGAGGGAGSAVAEGYPGYVYQFRARAVTTSGLVSAWSAIVSTEVSATATRSHPFSGLYTLDVYGGVNADSSPPLAASAYWLGWKIARAAEAQPGATSPQSGLVLDGFGGLHPYGALITVGGSPYWGWDIARDFAFLPDGSGGYVLDGYGGLHPFAVSGHAMPPAVTGGTYWAGWDVARKVVIFSDGSGGYVMDAYGGLHPFGIGGAPPASPTGGPYWAGWQIARTVVLIPGSHAGYVLDGYGGLSSFNGAPAVAAPAYWRGWDIARSIWLLPSATLAAPAGYVLDGYGGLHPFGGAPALAGGPYWGQDLAKGLWGA